MITFHSIIFIQATVSRFAARDQAVVGKETKQNGGEKNSSSTSNGVVICELVLASFANVLSNDQTVVDFILWHSTDLAETNPTLKRL